LIRKPVNLRTVATPRHDQAPRRRPKRGTTILDIARKLGLSAMTVSRALTGNPEVSEATKRKVLRCAEAMGYRPNRWARSLVTRKSSIVGVVIPDISHSFFAEITCGIEEVLEKTGYNILLCHSRGSVEKERAEIETLIGSRVDGLIIASEQPESSPKPFQELIDRHIPFVLVDRFFPKQGFTSVRADDRAVGKIATGHLLALGHRRIAHIEGPRLSPASLRHRGYLGTLKAAGILMDRHLVVRGNFDIPTGAAAMRQLLQLDPRPTAVFTANDPMAIGAVYACREAGLRVPEDISIVGAGNIEGPHHPNPFLTTVDWPRTELGRVAGELLLRAMQASTQARPEGKVFEPRLLVRQSTGPIRT
jgi:DNA-binding LacI/PurR family transcriptional regulator